jgi:5-methylcytosine-specific restriction endonuclease McrA
MVLLSQESLWCSCGCTVVNRHGRCARCQRQQKLSREAFGGNRDRALTRDGRRCQGCGGVKDLLVHHRQPGLDFLRLLITLCRSCHTRIHRTYRPQFGFPAELRNLWREAHPDLAEQLELALTVGPLLQAGPQYQASLFDAA